MAFAYYVKEPTTDGLETVLDRLQTFTAPRTKRLLIVENNEIERRSIIDLLGHTDIEIVATPTGAEALDALTHSGFDCMVLDLHLPDMTGFCAA
jgi:CheY-like chemotaxis protein